MLNLTDDDIKTLDGIVRELEQVTTLEEYIKLDRAFHLQTYAAARMPQLLTMIERFWNGTQHFRCQFVSEAYGKDGFPFTDPQHLLIMDALRARDVEAAQAVVRLHIRHTRARAEQTREQHLRMEKLEERVRLRRVLIAAVLKVMSTKGLSEADAFDLIRRCAMEQRKSIEQMGAEIMASGHLQEHSKRTA